MIQNNDDVHEFIDLFGELSLTLTLAEPWLQGAQEMELFIEGDLALARVAQALARVFMAYEKGTLDVEALRRAATTLDGAQRVVARAHEAAEAARAARDNTGALAENRSRPEPRPVSPPPTPTARPVSTRRRSLAMSPIP
jgi:hypothetical protein